MSEGAPSVLVLSHLYPSTQHPHLGIFVARLVRALRETHDMRVLAPTRWLPPFTRSWRRERKLPRREVDDGTPVYRPRVPQLPFGGMTPEALACPVALGPLTRRLERERAIDLVHAHFGVPDGWAGARLAKRLRAPLVLSLWGSDVLVHARRPGPRRLLSHALSRAGQVIAPSQSLADRALELGADPDRTSVVMGGVPDGYCRASRADARAGLAISPDVRLVVWVGNLVAVKRPLLALEAISLVVARDRDVRLAVIGDGPLRSAVHEKVRELGVEGAVIVLGALESAAVARWQAAADVVLSTSRSEGLSFALAEALVCGTRAVAVSVGGVPDLLAATSGGTLARGAGPEALAEALDYELGLPPDRDLSQRSAFLLLSGVAPRIAEIYSRSL